MPKSLRIGLLGGSFNPAHEGHLHISMEALKRLDLDFIWWLVTPQNPLKPTCDMAPYAKRFTSAEAMTHGAVRITVSDFERQRGLHYTYATLKALMRRFPRIQFVWLMGADNLEGFHHWQRWRQIARMVPIAVFDRSPFSYTALRSKAALALKGTRLRESGINAIAHHPGHWAYILMRRHPASSTEIRQQRLKKSA